MTWVHWVLYNIPPTETGLDEGVGASSSSSSSFAAAQNDWKQSGYGGPSPPRGRHRYFHKLYALDCMLPDLGHKATKATLMNAMQGHVIGQTELIGTYQKAS